MPSAIFKKVENNCFLTSSCHAIAQLVYHLLMTQVCLILGGVFTWVTQMRQKDYQPIRVILHQLTWLTGA